MDFDLREYLWCLELDFDPDAQLSAIQALVKQHRAAAAKIDHELRRLEAHAKQLAGARSEAASDALTDSMHYSVYQAAAHSMAAVGMLAPLTETIFVEAFRAIGKRFLSPSEINPQHIRWRLHQNAVWDCHFVIETTRREKHLVHGIVQLADAISLQRYLPEDLQKTLSLLFEYRNKMFHHGFEWPLEVRNAFANRVAAGGWETSWVSAAWSGDDPWVFFLTDVFIDHCVATVNESLDSIARFLRDDLLPRQRARN
jgi:hypothetical protein